MAASDNIDIGKPSWPKWLLALLIGAPVTIGVGYYYLKKKDISKDINSDRNGTVKPKLNIQEDPPKKKPESAVPETPLERATSLKMSGNEFYKKGNYTDAIRCYSEAISVCPISERTQLSMIYQNRAAAHELLNNLEEVMKDCGKAIELNPIYTKALGRRSKAAEHLGQLTTALEDTTEICILERFENVTTLFQADRLLKQLGAEKAKEVMSTKPPVSPSKFFVQTYLKTFVTDPFSDSETQTEDSGNLSVAKEALREGKLQDAIQAATGRLADDDAAGTPNSREHYLSLLLRATALFLSGRSALAMTDLSNIISDNPPFPAIAVNALVKRAALHLQMDDIDKCLEDFSTAEKIDPNNPDIYHQRGQVHVSTEKLEEASVDYEKAVALAPNFGLAVLQRLYTVYRRRAAERDASGMEDATRQLAASADTYPDLPEGFLLLGQVYADQQKYEDADRAFDKARKQSPNNANVLVHKGLLELQWHSDTEKSVAYLEKAIEVDSKCEFAYETLASIEVQRANLARGVELFEKALELAKSEKEIKHICALKVAAEAQQVVSRRLGLH